MLDGVILLWFILTALSVVFVAIDIRTTPESTVMKWGFVLVTLFTGPFGAFLYVLGCREPLPGLHEAYVAAPWRQALGSTMHCVAGDGVGILVGAVIAALLSLPPLADFVLEYALGFMFGWGIFQALFMRDMVGGSYSKALTTTFIPELTSMNCLMAGMAIVSMIGKANVAGSEHPSSPAFWFIMSMALLVGLCAAYPMNYWLVANKLKHGMTTVRPKGLVPPMAAKPGKAAMSGMSGTTEMPANGEMAKAEGGHSHMDMRPKVTAQTIALVVGLSFVILIVGLTIGLSFAQSRVATSVHGWALPTSVTCRKPTTNQRRSVPNATFCNAKNCRSDPLASRVWYADHHTSSVHVLSTAYECGTFARRMLPSCRTCLSHPATDRLAYSTNTEDTHEL